MLRLSRISAWRWRGPIRCPAGPSLHRTSHARKMGFRADHALGRTLGERVALEGTNWLNLRFVTPLDIALPMGAPFLVERGINPSEDNLGPALMMRLLLDL